MDDVAGPRFGRIPGDGRSGEGADNRDVLGHVVSFSRRFNAEFEKLAASRPWRFAAVYLDDEENPLWEEYAVEVVPTLALFREGKVADRLDGILGYAIDNRMVEAFVRRVEAALA